MSLFLTRLSRYIRTRFLADVRPANSHVYTDLHAATQQIRLVVLSPAKTYSSDIHASLVTVSLQDNVEYEALSYVWGQKGRKSVIHLDGKSFAVTSNLEIALRYLRQNSEIRTLWIDAICINQQNIKERNVQVQQMKAIYSKARLVLIWLGARSENSDAAMGYLKQQIHNSFTNPSKLSANVKQGLQNIMARPWWTRMWVMQELAVAARDPVVGCGYRWVEWDKFKAFGTLLMFSESIGRPREFEKEEWDSLWHTVSSRMIFDGRRDDHQAHLPKLLEYTQSRHASDARDHVLAIVGLTSESEQADLLPDYGESVTAIYQRAMVMCIRAHNSLDFLCAARDPDRSDLPTWCPDFSKPGWKFDLRLIWQPELASDSLELPASNTTSDIPVSNATDNGSSVTSPLASVFASIYQQDSEESKNLDGASKALECVSLTHEVQTSTLTVAGVLVGEVNCVTQPLSKPVGVRMNTPSEIEMKVIHKNMASFLEAIDQFQPLARLALEHRLGPEDSQRCFAEESLLRVLMRDMQLASGHFPCLSAAGDGDVYAGFHSVIQRDSFNIDDPVLGDIASFAMLISMELADVSLITTDTGYFGRGPHSVRQGDLLCILFGCKLPVFLRPHGERYRLLGIGHVQGIMDGELVADRENLKSEHFSLC